MIKRINAVFFSATGTTGSIVRRVSGRLSRELAGVSDTEYDFTLPVARASRPDVLPGDLVVFGVPVYAGRVPNVLLPYISSIEGHGAPAVAVAVYGNRDFDDALIELRDVLSRGGFRVFAAAAFIGEHAFSDTLAAGRPDGRDLAVADEFALGVSKKLLRGDCASPVPLEGHTPLRPYYTPRDREGRAVNILKVKPVVTASCVRCGRCAALCPMGSIDPLDVRRYTGICIKCGACVKRCPERARTYTDADYLYHKRELELGFASRKEPSVFL